MGNYYQDNTIGEMRDNGQPFADIIKELTEKGYSSRQILWKIEDHIISAEIREISQKANAVLHENQLSYKDRYMNIYQLLAQQVEQWSEVEAHLWFEEKVSYQIYQSLRHHRYSNNEIRKIVEGAMGFQLGAIPTKPKEPYEVEFPYWFPDGSFVMEVFYDAYRKNINQLTAEWTTRLVPLLHSDNKQILTETFDHPYLVLTENGSKEEHWYQQ